MVKVYEWTCPVCRKKIRSIWKNQFDYNKEQHIGFHERKDILILPRKIKRKVIKKMSREKR